MFNLVYRLTTPRHFEPIQSEAVVESASVIVRPTYLSICNADQRYYQGLRSEAALKEKLPMALIHEGIGFVVEDRSGLFEAGDRVVMLPNNPVEVSADIAENYLRSSKFCGSGCDGFMQEYVVLTAPRVLRLPEDIDNSVAAFTELVSVVLHSIKRFEKTAHQDRSTIGVWGDGNMGFITSLLLRIMLPSSKIIVFGRNPYKLEGFTFADEVYLTDEWHGQISINHAFECCGGEGAISAIAQIIDCISPEGTISLLGVSEMHVPVNTRMVLEKGLRIVGNSRSSRQDFEDTVELFEQDARLPQYLSSLVNQVMDVASIADIVEAFDVDSRKGMGKTIMQWNM